MPTYTTGVLTVGDVQRVTVTVTDSTGGVSTGSDCRFLVRTPSGTVAAYSTGSSGFASSTLGVYTQNIAAAEGGDYKWRFEATGEVTASTFGRFSVAPQQVST